MSCSKKFYFTECVGPFFEHQSWPNRIKDGEERIAKCKDGYETQTEVYERSCIDNKIVPDFFEFPVKCVKGY